MCTSAQHLTGPIYGFSLHKGVSNYEYALLHTPPHVFEQHLAVGIFLPHFAMSCQDSADFYLGKFDGTRSPLPGFAFFA